MKTKSLPPYAPTLIESTRAIGYSLEAAVADIIDNSIAANAKNVDIYFFPIDGAYIARRLIKTCQEKEALRIIIESKRVDKKAIEKAKNILVKEIIREDFQTESVEERQFIEHFNQEIQYDTTLKEAPLIAERTQYIYPRKQSEARSALRRAQYLCEVDNSHFVFKRRNRSDNYTEPHHLVPLSAHRDFPGIDLDREQNIVSLCSNCHNILHYGASYKEILYELYIQRRELLKQIGIVISFEQLVSYY